MIATRFAILSLLCVSLATPLSADISLIVDLNDGQLAIRGDGDRAVGILIASESGAIDIELDGNEVLESAEPFAFLFSATPNEFHATNDSAFNTIDGVVPISPSFDLTGIRDLQFFFNPPQPIGFVPGTTVYVPEPSGHQAWFAISILSVIGWRRKMVSLHLVVRKAPLQRQADKRLNAETSESSCQQLK